MQSATAQTIAGRDHVQGMVIMSIGMLILPVMDAIGKYLATEEAMSPGQVTFYRFLFQLIFTAIAIAIVSGRTGFQSQRFWLNILRGLVMGVASLCFFAAVKYMPIADALAIFFVEPFILTALSAIFLGEKVGWRRWTAIAVGFVGAVIVIEPSLARFGAVALLPLMTAMLFATYLLMNRMLGVHDGPLVMQYLAGIGGTAIAFVFIAVGGFAGIDNLQPSLPASGLSVALVLLLGALAAFGHGFVVLAFQKAPASVLAPFQYLEIVSAVLMGYFIFGDVPSLSKWVGIAIIVGSGLFIFWREQQVLES
ncbi:DMT family transporter [Pararhizobium haloflavum]|uniref:DMT family transporter n=1 Tax=Pararhizobium haloflavum TaxID=2037914 RepID=UPI001FDF5BD6|nr:DMT family transporter [Pararhizobium haloflavum]